MHNYEPLKTASFQILDQNWNHYENSPDLIEMMKTNPEAILEIINRLHRKKSGYLILPSNDQILMIKALNCLQEEIIKSFDEMISGTPREQALALPDMSLVSSTGQEIPCHRYILAVRSPVFKYMFALKKSSESLKLQVDVSTQALNNMLRYLYTDSVKNEDITEDLITLSHKYKLIQLKEFCLPTFIEMINADNCLKMYIYGYTHQFDEIKHAAYKLLDENWKLYECSSEFLEMMKNIPQAVLEIMNRFQKGSDCQPIVLEKVEPKLVDF